MRLKFRIALATLSQTNSTIFMNLCTVPVPLWVHTTISIGAQKTIGQYALHLSRYHFRVAVGYNTKIFDSEHFSREKNVVVESAKCWHTQK